VTCVLTVENRGVVDLLRGGALPLSLSRAVVAVAVVLSVMVMRPLAAADCAATPYACAADHVGRREFDAAIALLEPLLVRTPRDLKALNLLGIALTSAGRAEAGSVRFRQALAIDPAFDPARKNLAINAFNEGRLTEAQREFERLLAHAPGDEVIHLHLGEIHFKRKRLAQALPHYEKAGGRVVRNPAWALHHAEALLDQREADKAVALLGALRESDAASRFEAGVLLARSGRHAEAARFFGSARAGHKDAYAAAYNQTLMLIEAGDVAGAIRVAEDLFAAGMRPAELYNLVSRAYLAAGQVQQAYDALRAAARLEPKVVDHYLDLARIALDHQNFDLGLEIVDVGLGHLPESWVLYLQRGVLQAMKAQLGAAEKEFETARRLAPGQATPYAALAMVWMQTGQAPKAVEVLREEVRRGRGGPVVPFTFAMALMRSGVDPAAPEAAEAVEALRASLRANPDFAPARSELGRVLLRRGDVAGAVAELKRAVALDPASGAALYNLSQAYMKQGDRARAAEMAGRVSRLNAQERGDDADAEMKRVMYRLVRENPVRPQAPVKP
jgi:tetratricopeptide (TPR) repeat protein